MKQNYFKLYLFFNHPITKLIRFIMLAAFIYLFIVHSSESEFLRILLPFYFLFGLQEIFIQEKISKIKPDTISSIKNDPYHAILFDAQLTIHRKHDVQKIIVSFLKKEDVKYFLARLGKHTITPTHISSKNLINQAYILTKKHNGIYITPLDIVTSYILSSDSENDDFSEKDILTLYSWIRTKYNVDSISEKNVNIPSEGLFDFFVYGWSYELKKYASNLTNLVISKRFPPKIVELDTEYQEYLSGLAKNQEANVLIIGEAGGGKRTIVEYFAYQSYFGKTGGSLSRKIVYELYADRLISGIQNSGELEERLMTLFTELAYSGEVIVYIENIENLFGGGGIKLDAESVLINYLESTKIKIVGTITQSSYQKYIEPRSALKQYFSTVQIEEKTQEQTLQVLLEHLENLESEYGVWALYDAVKETVNLSSSYYPDRILPGSAIAMLKEVFSSAKLNEKTIISKHDVRKLLENKTKIITEEPSEEEKKLLLHLEDKIHEKLINQEEAVKAIASALRRLRTGFKNKKRPISTFLFLGPTGVGKTETAKRLAELYFGNIDSMIRIDMSEYQTQDSIRKFLGELPGEEIIENALVDKVVEKPFSLVLLDEFEKAHPQLLDLFLQIFDEATLTDNHGRHVSFKNTIIIATSNAGSEMIREMISHGENVDMLTKQIIDYLLLHNLFKPELVNRFDEVIVFKPLSIEHVRQVAQLLLTDNLNTLGKENYEIEFDETIIDKVVKEGYDAEFGARSVRRYIESTIEDVLSQAILENKIQKKNKRRLCLDEKGNFIIQ